MAFYTLWLTVFTGALAVSTIGLWVVTWKGVAGQSRDMKESIDVARKSADAALIAANIAEAVATGNDPPFLHATAEFVLEPTPYSVGTVMISFTNYGRSPAFVSFSRATVERAADHPKVDPFDPPPGFSHHDVVIDPGKSELIERKIVDNDLWASTTLPNGIGIALAVYGQVIYTDLQGADWRSVFNFVVVMSQAIRAGGAAFNFRERLSPEQQRRLRGAS